MIDIPNAFVQTCLEDDKDKEAVMLLHGKPAKLMVKVAPKICTEHVIINFKGKSVLCVCHPKNTLCGIMKAACPACCQCFVTNLKLIAFEGNPCDPCAANKIVEAKQLTVVWHVDDLKVSHVNTSVITRMASWLKSTCGQLFDDDSGAKQISRGKIHKCLGMPPNFTVPGEVKITMIPCIKEIVQLLAQHDNSESTADTPAAEHLFNVNDKTTSLTERQATMFHNFVALCLFLAKQARPDVSTAMAFLTACIKGPNEDDWKKLA
jgi:hypothetical protein